MTSPNEEEIHRSIQEFKNRKVFSSFDLSTLESIPDDKVEQAIIDYVLLQIANDFSDELEILNELSAGFRSIYTTWCVEGEVNNGGFNQYFWNSEGRTALLAVDAFKRVGAPEYAELLERAIVMWKDEESALSPYKEENTLQSFSESYEHTNLGNLDDEFFKLAAVSDLSAIRIRYIRSNPREFVTSS
jgi:Domain of unknown function (DUF4375)